MEEKNKKSFKKRSLWLPIILTMLITTFCHPKNSKELLFYLLVLIPSLVIVAIIINKAWSLIEDN